MGKSIFEHEAEKFLQQIENAGLSYDVHNPCCYDPNDYKKRPKRVVFHGGDEQTRKKFEDTLKRKDKLIEAVLVYEYAKKRDPDLLYVIEERTAIRHFGTGFKEPQLPNSPYQAILSYFHNDDNDSNESEPAAQNKNIDMEEDLFI